MLGSLRPGGELGCHTEVLRQAGIQLLKAGKESGNRAEVMAIFIANPGRGGGRARLVFEASGELGVLFIYFYFYCYLLFFLQQLPRGL